MNNPEQKCRKDFKVAGLVDDEPWIVRGCRKLWFLFVVAGTGGHWNDFFWPPPGPGRISGRNAENTCPHNFGSRKQWRLCNTVGVGLGLASLPPVRLAYSCWILPPQAASALSASVSAAQAKRQAEQEKKKQEAEARKLEEAKKKEEAEKARAEEAAKRKADEEKKKQEAEAKKLEEAKKKEEAEKARAEEAAKRKAEEEEKKKEAEARGQDLSCFSPVI